MRTSQQYWLLATCVAAALHATGARAQDNAAVPPSNRADGVFPEPLPPPKSTDPPLVEVVPEDEPSDASERRSNQAAEPETFDDMEDLDPGEDAHATQSDRVWVALWLPDLPKPVLEEKKAALVLLGMLPFGGSVIAPMFLLDMPFDAEWALPSILFNIAAASLVVGGVVCWWIPYIGWTLGFLVLLGALASAVALLWLANMTSLANLNRPDVVVPHDGSPPPRKHKKRRRRPQHDDED